MICGIFTLPNRFTSLEPQQLVVRVANRMQFCGWQTATNMESSNILMRLTDHQQRHKKVTF